MNTLAGMIPDMSDFVKLLDFYGMTYDELVAMIVGQALSRTRGQ